MRHLKMLFSLASLVFCAGFVLSAGATPSVRILGSSAGYSGIKAPAGTITSVKKGNTTSSAVLNTGSGAKKVASTKTPAIQNNVVTPGIRSASSKGGIATTKTAVTKAPERFPGISTKSNVQSVSKVNVLATSEQSGNTNSGYNIQEMNNRLNDVERFLDSDIATTKLSDHYYTKEGIEQYIEDRVSGMDASASSLAIQKLRRDVNAHDEWINEIEETIENLQATDGGIYDSYTNEKKAVYIEDSFNANDVLGAVANGG